VCSGASTSPAPPTRTTSAADASPPPATCEGRRREISVDLS
jgi:hypothetical protein